MSLINTKPSDNYDQLKIQFYSLVRLLQCSGVELGFYRKKFNEFNFKRIIELEAQLESEKEMNAILTKELEKK